MSVFDEKYRARLERLSTTNLSDALDAYGLTGATYGIRPVIESWGKIVGRAVTVKLKPFDGVTPKHHLGIRAIDAAESGDIIVIANDGKLNISCWGGCLANGAKMKGVSGVVIDGASRDIDDCMEINFPVYARGTVVATARGRAVEESTNEPINFAGVEVKPGDVVMGDHSGVVIVPWEHLDKVLEKAEALCDKEDHMIHDLRSGMSMVEVDLKYNYEKMLK
jgi:regulator of RNase E activity RraA